MMRTLSRLVFTTMIVAGTTACGGEASNARSGANAPDGRAPEPTTAEPTQVSVDPELARMCDLPTPRFAFDRASLGSDTSSPLQALASCLTTGPAKHVALRLVGHADPRGETEYNFALGHRRSGSVEEFLRTQGVAAERLATSSRGELDATGADEDGWAADRRVDVLLRP